MPSWLAGPSKEEEAVVVVPRSLAVVVRPPLPAMGRLRLTHRVQQHRQWPPEPRATMALSRAEKCTILREQ